MKTDVQATPMGDPPAASCEDAAQRVLRPEDALRCAEQILTARPREEFAAASTGPTVTPALHTTDASQSTGRIISLSPPHQHAEGRNQHGMQTFDQSHMELLRRGLAIQGAALRFATNPSEFQLRASAAEAFSDLTFDTASGRREG